MKNSRGFRYNHGRAFLCGYIVGQVLKGDEGMFFNGFDERAREIFKVDKSKHNVLSWIIYNTNYQEEYKGLTNRECYFIGIHIMVARQQKILWKL